MQQTARKRSGQTLQRRVAVIVVTGLVASFGLFGFLAMQAVRESTEAVFQERLMMAKITADHIDFQLMQALDFLEAQSQARTVDLAASRVATQREALADIRARLPIEAQQVYVVDRNGSVLAADPPTSRLEGASMFDYVHMRRVLEGSKREVSGVILDPVTRNPTVAFAVRITDASGRTVGALGASMDIQRASLAALIMGLKPGEQGHTQILDGNGTVMASTDPSLVLRRSHHYELLFSLIRQKSSAVVSHLVEHETSAFAEIVAFAPLANASWGVSVEQSEAEALAVGYQLQFRLAILGILSLLGALGTSVLVLRRVLKPVESLTLASERIASGDLSGRIEASGNDEVGRLAMAFEVMRERLRLSREELDAWHRELEVRVQQRTAELSCLFELSKTIASSLDLDEMLHAAVRKTVEVLGSADAACLYIYDRSDGRLVLRAWYGSLPDGAGNCLQGLSARTVESGEPFSRSEAELAASGCRVGSEGAVVTCAPVRTQEQVFGALVLVNLSGSAPQAGLALVQAMADQIAVGLEREDLGREAEQAAALREADRLKSEFISAITHDLQTPIGFIKGYATTLLRPHTDFDEKTRREFLQIIDDESDSLSALVDDLLDVSRIEAGALSLEPSPLQMSRVVERVVERAAAKSPGYAFKLRVSERPPLVEADARRMEQVLHNLLDNAVKYSAEGGTIAVSVETRGQQVVVSVQDQGMGIPIEEQGRVFERFYRAPGAAAASRRGAGLGLSICRGIVEAHGGSIWLESSPGRGTKVSFSLPVVEAEEPAEAGAREGAM